MPRRFLPALLATLALALVLASCGGGAGGTTTTRERVVTHSQRQGGHAQSLRRPTFLPDVATDRRFVKPRTYRFSVDGDLIGKGLEWHGWGDATATALGTIVERPASGLVDTFSGSVTASVLRTCGGVAYYTEVIAHVPKQADFVPTEPTKLSTPCD